MGIISLPVDLTCRPQWVLWRYVPREGKHAKIPCTAMGYRADVTNSQHWSEYGYVADLLRKRPEFAAGIGFVFTQDDPFCGVDLDNCFPSDASECAPWASGILERFGDTYSEVSPSGMGVKIWCRAKTPRCGKWTLDAGAIEIYDNGRFFTVTGNAGPSIPRVIVDHQGDIEALVTHLDKSRTARPRRIDTVITKGKRHNTLASIAGTMWRRGMNADAIEAALLVTNEKQCDPPYDPQHIHRLVADMAAKWSRV